MKYFYFDFFDKIAELVCGEIVATNFEIFPQFFFQQSNVHSLNCSGECFESKI